MTDFYVGQRVTVTGEQDGMEFFKEPGTIAHVAEHGVLVRFDDWREGHGKDCREWFVDQKLVTLVITTQKRGKKAPHGSQEYKGNGNHTWEHVASDTHRLRVPGGWLYRSIDYGKASIAFVPVPEVVGYAV